MQDPQEEQSTLGQCQQHLKYWVGGVGGFLPRPISWCFCLCTFSPSRGLDPPWHIAGVFMGKTSLAPVEGVEKRERENPVLVLLRL